jgi:predicted nucleotidyltransferase
MQGGSEGRDAIEREAMRIAEAHGCHTTILYGSRARGDATAGSDVDFICIRDSGPALRDARVVDGTYFDAFIYPESAVKTPDASLLRVLPGVVLRERDGFGTALLRKIQEVHDRGPEPLPEDERTARIVWAHKMVERIRGQGGSDADYRRMSLLLTSLEDHFALRGRWFRGSKEAFAWLRARDPSAHAAFELAMRPGATERAIADLVAVVYGSTLPPGG